MGILRAIGKVATKSTNMGNPWPGRHVCPTERLWKNNKGYKDGEIVQPYKWVREFLLYINFFFNRSFWAFFCRDWFTVKSSVITQSQKDPFIHHFKVKAYIYMLPLYFDLTFTCIQIIAFIFFWVTKRLQPFQAIKIDTTPIFRPENYPASKIQNQKAGKPVYKYIVIWHFSTSVVMRTAHSERMTHKDNCFDPGDACWHHCPVATVEFLAI